jgi:hypothetical protein
LDATIIFLEQRHNYKYLLVDIYVNLEAMAAEAERLHARTLSAMETKYMN